MSLFGKIGIIKNFVSVYRIHSSNLLKNSKIDYNLIVSNSDHIIEPYLLAKQLNVILYKDLNSWKKRLVIPTIQKTLFKVFKQHKHKYHETIKYFEDKDEILLHESMKNLKYKIIILLIKILY